MRGGLQRALEHRRLGKEIVKGEALLAILLSLKAARRSSARRSGGDINLFLRRETNMLHAIKIQDRSFTSSRSFDIPRVRGAQRAQEELFRYVLNAISLVHIYVRAPEARKARSRRSGTTTSRESNLTRRGSNHKNLSWASRLKEGMTGANAGQAEEDTTSVQDSTKAMRITVGRTLEILSILGLEPRVRRYAPAAHDPRREDPAEEQHAALEDGLPCRVARARRDRLHAGFIFHHPAAREFLETDKTLLEKTRSHYLRCVAMSAVDAGAVANDKGVLPGQARLRIRALHRARRGRGRLHRRRESWKTCPCRAGGVRNWYDRH